MIMSAFGAETFPTNQCVWLQLLGMKSFYRILFMLGDTNFKSIIDPSSAGAVWRRASYLVITVLAYFVVPTGVVP